MSSRDFNLDFITNLSAFGFVEVMFPSIYNNRKMSRHARSLRGRKGGRRRARAGIEGSGGGGQAKIAMSRQGRGLRGWTDGWVGTGNPPQSGVTACNVEDCM